MGLSVPHYLQTANIQDNSISYEWDDWRAISAVKTPDDKLVARLKGISYRAILAFMCGTAEWTVHRFSRLCDPSRPYAFIEAAWARIVHVRYGEYGGALSWQSICLESEEWSGPVKKPIADALLRLEIAIQVMAWEGTDPAKRGGLIAALASYVMTDPEPYQRWCQQVLERFEAFNSRNPEDKLGDVVPRQAVAPEFDFKIGQTESLINEFLSRLDHHSNIFLSSPEGMLEDDDPEDEVFTGTPYVFDIETDRKSRRES